jgi:hypothetical protein
MVFAVRPLLAPKRHQLPATCYMLNFIRILLGFVYELFMIFSKVLQKPLKNQI